MCSPGALTAVMSSESTLHPRHALGAYTSSKAALELSMRVWRMEKAPLRFTTLIIGGTFPTDFGAEFEMERLLPAMEAWATHGAVQEGLMDTTVVADAVAGALSAIVDQPTISFDTVVVRSPSPIVGSSSHLEADAVEHIASING